MAVINDVRQKEMQTAEPLTPMPSPFKVKIAVGKLRSKSPDTDQILAKFIQVGGNTLHSEICKLINSN
jgi:hypothetical protein